MHFVFAGWHSNDILLNNKTNFFNPLRPRSPLRAIFLKLKKTGIALEGDSDQSTGMHGNPPFFLFISANENIDVAKR